jgi:NADPH:quinone reductase-like Zn-dependent oxidoreductase
MPMYGTEFMAKSLTFVWALLGTKPYYGVQPESHGKILERLSGLLDSRTVKCHCMQKLKFDEGALREAHEIIEDGKAIGKVALEFERDSVFPRLTEHLRISSIPV